MNVQVDRVQENKKPLPASAVTQQQVDGGPAVRVDSRPEGVLMRKVQELADNSPQAKQMRSLQTMAHDYTARHRQPTEHHDFFELAFQAPAMNPLDVKRHSNGAVAQRSFSVQTEEEGDNVTGLKIKERPFVKQRVEELDDHLIKIYPHEYESPGKLKAGAIRAHIIGWNVKSREYVSGLGLPMKKTDLINKFQKENIQDTIKQIRYELTNIFYDHANYTINSAEAEQGDRDALRVAGQKYSEQKKIADLKDIYTLSFNTGKYGHGKEKVKEYQESFSRAYGIELKVLKQWKLRLPETEDKEMPEEGKEDSDFYTLEDLKEMDAIEDYGAMLSIAKKLCDDYKHVEDVLKKQYIAYVVKIHDELLGDDEAAKLFKSELKDMQVFLKSAT
jgi:hypothetical protein